MKTNSKCGRKPKPFFYSQEGQYINGLRKRKDNRWELANGQTFSEADEGKAVARYRAMVGEDGGRTEAREEFRLSQVMNWGWLREQILQRPLWVAEKVGIEQIGYLTDLKAPVPLPSLDEIQNFWIENAKCSKLQMKKVLRAWKDFRSNIGIGGLRDITRKIVTAYEKNVQEREITPKQQQHLVGGIRRILRFYRAKQDGGSVEITEALNALMGFELDESPNEDNPNPITVEDWQSIHKMATGEDLAMILLMLNGAFYIGEVIERKWEEIQNGCIVSRRKKKGKCIRVCVLWTETIEALKAIPKREDGYIFHNYRGEKLGIDGAQLRFEKLTDKANVPHVTGSMLRDGTYTASCNAKIPLQFCEILAGHKTGMKDRYIKRTPSQVAEACAAVRAHYFGLLTESLPMVKAA